MWGPHSSLEIGIQLDDFPQTWSDVHDCSLIGCGEDHHVINAPSLSESAEIDREIYSETCRETMTKSEEWTF